MVEDYKKSLRRYLKIVGALSAVLFCFGVPFSEPVLTIAGATGLFAAINTWKECEL